MQVKEEHHHEDKKNDHEEGFEKEKLTAEDMLFSMETAKRTTANWDNEENGEEKEELEVLSILECSRSIDLNVYNLRTVIDDIAYFPGNITVRSSWSKFKHVIIKYLEDDGAGGIPSFRKTCFGRFLDLSDHWTKGFSGMLCHYLLLHSVPSEKKWEMWFIVDRKPVRFGMKEFAIVTGLNCGPKPSSNVEEKVGESGIFFLKRVLQEKESVTGKDLEEKLDNDTYDASDKFKMCLVLFLHSILMAADNSKKVEPDWLLFVNDIEFFNSYPWGSLSFQMTIKSLRTRNLHKAYLEWQGNKKLQKYNVQGFPWALLAWAYEAIPAFGKAGHRLSPSKKDPLLPIPRILQWHAKRSPLWDFDRIESELKENEVFVHPFLIPTKREMREHYVTSLEELEDVSDESIDRMKNDLKGVTKLTTHIVSHFDHTFEDYDVVPEQKNVENEKIQTDSKSTQVPLHSSVHHSEMMKLLKGLSEQFVDLKAFVMDKMDKLEKKVDLIQQIIEKGSEKERKRSHYLVSPFTVEGKLKKAKGTENI